MPSDAVSDVIDGLVTLGYSVLQARDAVKNLDTKGKTSEQLLREALRSVR
jgi:Holliday junction resolvasome RuvABC DNA-binding subunit